jgi:hypothetical protein
MKAPAARLFEVPLDEFVGARNALAKELRKAGHEDEAEAVAALKKPSKALWLVNQLSRRAPIPLQALIAATRKIREAQEQGLAGDEVREGMRAQRAALAALTAAAGDAASERRIHDTLQAAALAEPEALREGRLLQELAPAGFGALLGADVQPLQPKAPEKPQAKERHARDKDDAKLAAEKAAARATAGKEAAKLAAHADSLEAAAAKAEHAAKEAETESTRAAKLAAKAADTAAKASESATRAREEATAAREQAIAAKTHFQKMT